MPEIERTFYMREQVARAESWMPIIAGLLPGERNIDKLWQSSRDTPYYVPREAFRIAAREWQDHEVVVDLINRLPEDTYIPRRWHKEGYQHMSKKYLTVIEFDGYELETGKAIKQTIPVYSDEQHTLEEIYEEAMERFAEGEYGMEFVGVSVGLAVAYHQEGASW